MKIAHITDLHLRGCQPGTAIIGKRRSYEMTTLFPKALEKIKEQNPDFLAVTGDLLDAPTWMMFPIQGFTADVPKFWLDAAEEDYRQIKAWLDSTGIPYMVMPGNHDLPEAMWKVFDPKANSLEVGGVLFARFCDYEHDGHRPRRFYPERDRWEQLLQQEGRPQVHLQHYVITPTLNAGYPHTYEEGEELVRRMSASGQVYLSLSGHYHRGTVLMEYGTTTFATAPAFCEAPHPWRIYDLDLDTRKVQFEEHSLGAQASRPVVFLDRDGVINTLPSYRMGIEEMELVPGSAEAIRRLNEAGYATVVVTNQSAVGAGYVPESVVVMVNDAMHRLLAEEAGARLDAIYYTTGAGERANLQRYMDNSRAKPAACMLQEATAELNLDSKNAWMVGDNIVDMEAALAYGARPILVQSGNGLNVESKVRERWPQIPVLSDLRAAVEYILSR